MNYIETATQIKKCKKLLILDRDGVINFDSEGYFHDLSRIIYIDKNIELIKEYVEDKWTVCVATNQSGINRGYFSFETFQKLCFKMYQDLLLKGIKIQRWYFCPHNPDKETCSCRKPSPEMLLAAINYFKPIEALFIGDKESDKLAAENANIRFIKV